MRKTLCVLGLGVISGLGGCLSVPFGQSLTNIDWDAKSSSGTIAVSDPKMYRREALINERRLETVWLDDLLDKSQGQEFKSELVREIEQIQAFSLAAGIKIDPASAIAYRRQDSLSDTQFEIDSLKTQLQLDQLKRDIELYEKKRIAQTEPVNQDINRLSPSSSSAADSSVSATEQLKALIEQLKTTVATRLDSPGKETATANTSASPADLFRDRQAYRSLLKTARNAASLDELHDSDGASLIRLTFQASVLPDRRPSNIAGVVQIRIKQPDFTSIEFEDAYEDWLTYINEKLNLPDDSGGWSPNAELLNSAVANYFQPVFYLYTQPPAPAAAGKTAPKGKGKGKAVPAAVAPPNCQGIIFDNTDPAVAKCGFLTFAAPRFTGLTSQEGSVTDVSRYVQNFRLDKSDQDDLAHYLALKKLIRDHGRTMTAGCSLPVAPIVPAGASITPQKQLLDGLMLARNRLSGGGILTAMDRKAQRMLASRQIAAPKNEAMVRIALRTARAEMLLMSFEREAYANECSITQRTAFRREIATLFVPPEFQAVLTDPTGRVSIYEVGPQEQVQQVSTVLRNANSLQLALALSASAPRSGAALDAATTFSRQAIGKAAQLERVPAVLGYSVMSKDTFGWVLGPKAIAEANGRVNLEQTLKTFDLSADLSVPSWWQWIDVEATTSWAPTVQDVSHGEVKIRPENTRTVRVKLPKNSADFATLTTRLTLGGRLAPKETVIWPENLKWQGVDACKAMTLFIRGDNVWRTSDVVIGGYRLNSKAISVAADMSGILVDVPALGELLPSNASSSLRLTVITPYGPAEHYPIKYDKAGSGCEPEKSKPRGPTIEDYFPKEVSKGGKLDFRISGAKIDQIDKVTLDSKPGMINPTRPKDGSWLEVSFSAEQAASLPISNDVTLRFYNKKDEEIDSRTIEVQGK